MRLTGGWKKLYKIFFCSQILGDQIKKDEMGAAGSMLGTPKKCKQHFRRF
jgi:hypothetical protein